MTEFKQIVGRGTRVHEDTRKFYLTLIDFRGATSHFADPDFDGEPVQIYEPGEAIPLRRPTSKCQLKLMRTASLTKWAWMNIVDQPRLPLPPDGGPQRKIDVDGVRASIIAERVEYLDENGKLVTESLRDFTKKALRTTSPASMTSSSAGGPQRANRRSSKNWKPRACRSTRLPRSWAEPRPVRPHLSHRFRQKAADPARARRERQKARRVHQIRRRGPRRARCLACQICRRRRAQSR